MQNHMQIPFTYLIHMLKGLQTSSVCVNLELRSIICIYHKENKDRAGQPAPAATVCVHSNG